MDIGLFEKREIRKYFLLSDRIRHISEEIAGMRSIFYDQTMETMLQSDGIEYRVTAFSVEYNVNKLVDCINNKEQIMKQLKQKQKFFKRYLNTLPQDEQIRLKRRHTHGPYPHEVELQDIRLYDEILEIEDAINFMYGYEVEIRAAEPVEEETPKDSINRIAEMLGI